MSRRQAAVARALPVLPTTLLLLFLLLLHVGPSRVGVHALQGYITRFLGHHTPSGVAVDGAAREVGFVDIREVKYHGGYLWLLSGARDKAIGTLKAGTDRRDNVAVRRVSLDTGETVTYLGGYAPCPDGTSGVAQRQGYLCAPKGMDFDSSGNMWLGSKNGLMKVVPGDASTFWAPTVKYHSTSSDITGYVDVVIGADDVVYIATESSIKKYDPAAGGAPATWVGSAATDPASRADGVLAAAKFYQLSRMTISADGATLYLLEYFDRIRKVDVSTGAVTTLSHFNCSSAISVRSFGSPAVLQCFEDLEADPNGNIWVLPFSSYAQLFDCSLSVGTEEPATPVRVGMPGVCGAMDQVFWEALKDGPLDTTPLHFPQALAFHPSVPGVAFIAEAAGQNIHTGQAVEDVSILRVMHSLCTNTTAGACDPALLSAEANATAKPFAWSLQ